MISNIDRLKILDYIEDAAWQRLDDIGKGRGQVDISARGRRESQREELERIELSQRVRRGLPRENPPIIPPGREA